MRLLPNSGASKLLCISFSFRNKISSIFPTTKGICFLHIICFPLTFMQPVGLHASLNIKNDASKTPPAQNREFPFTQRLTSWPDQVTESGWRTKRPPLNSRDQGMWPTKPSVCPWWVSHVSTDVGGARRSVVFHMNHAPWSWGGAWWDGRRAATKASLWRASVLRGQRRLI